jgi:DNA-binding HxlR family transcriptional regulator
VPRRPAAERGTPFRCPVQLTLAVIGGKWKPMLLWELRAGARGFNALHAALPGLSPKVLAEQLRQLERDGIVARTTHEGRVRRVSYALTPFGRTLRPSLDALARWAKAHHAAVGATLAPPA